MAALVGTLMVGGALTLPALSFAQTPRELARQRAANFPEMHQARQRLEEAKRILSQRAAHDFHGHKTAAVTHIDQAIQEINLGIQAEGGKP